MRNKPVDSTEIPNKDAVLKPDSHPYDTEGDCTCEACMDALVSELVGLINTDVR